MDLKLKIPLKNQTTQKLGNECESSPLKLLQIVKLERKFTKDLNNLHPNRHIINLIVIHEQLIIEEQRPIRP